MNPALFGPTVAIGLFGGETRAWVVSFAVKGILVTATTLPTKFRRIKKLVVDQRREGGRLLLRSFENI